MISAPSIFDLSPGGTGLSPSPRVRRWRQPVYSDFVESELEAPVVTAPGAPAPGVVAAGASLSKCHNFHEQIKSENPKESRLLTGSAAKTARALRWNVQFMVDQVGINSIGFLTFTPGDYMCRVHGKQLPKGKQRCPCCGLKMDFCKIRDADEANRRVKSFYGGVLDDLMPMSILVKERHADGGNHFHIIGELSGRPDIRTGFDFREVRWGDYSNVSPELKAIWKILRAKAPLYGFGARVELLPIRKTGEAGASYVAKYIEKHVAHRSPEDRGRRLVRYHGFKGGQLKPNEFEWNGVNAQAWRARMREVLSLIGVPLMDLPVNPPTHVKAACAAGVGDIRPKCLDGSAARNVLGSRWAFKVQRLLEGLYLAKSEVFSPEYRAKSILSAHLQRAAGRNWCRQYENPPSTLCGIEMFRRDINDYFSTCPKAKGEPAKK